MTADDSRPEQELLLAGRPTERWVTYADKALDYHILDSRWFFWAFVGAAFIIYDDHLGGSSDTENGVFLEPPAEHELEYQDSNESYCHTCENTIPNAHVRGHGHPSEPEGPDGGDANE